MIRIDKKEMEKVFDVYYSDKSGFWLVSFKEKVIQKIDDDSGPLQEHIKERRRRYKRAGTIFKPETPLCCPFQAQTRPVYYDKISDTGFWTLFRESHITWESKYEFGKAMLLTAKRKRIVREKMRKVGEFYFPKKGKWAAKIE
mgnify:CR=1 FL=1